MSQFKLTEHALWRQSEEEDRQREPLGHMTDEVIVHAVKEEEKRNNLFDTFLLFLSVLPLSLSCTHSLTRSLSDAFFFSMEAMRRKQVWGFLEGHKGKDMLAFYSAPLVGFEWSEEVEFFSS